jgi:hypothetical protein
MGIKFRKREHLGQILTKNRLRSPLVEKSPACIAITLTKLNNLRKNNCLPENDFRQVSDMHQNSLCAIVDIVPIPVEKPRLPLVRYPSSNVTRSTEDEDGLGPADRMKPRYGICIAPRVVNTVKANLCVCRKNYCAC